MEKLLRFFALSVLFVASFLFMFSLLPFVTWVFGGSFTGVIQSVPYVLFGGTFLLLFLSFLFSECFDSNFYSKK